MRFNYNHVMVFLEVAEKGSINGAAQLRHVAQSAVSRIMRELELSLKVKLLERHAWGIEVTDAGRVVLQLAKNIRAEATATDLSLSRLREGNNAVTLSIGAHPTLAAYVLPQVIGRFGERAPTCQVIVREGMKEDLIPLLSNGELDVLVCRIGNSELPSGLVEELIYHDTMVVLAGHQHPLAARRRLQASDMLAAQWILPPPDAEPYKDVTATFDFLGIAMPTPKLQTASVGLIRSLLLGEPHWLAIMPRDMFRADIRARRLKVLSEAPKTTHRPMGLILRRRAASDQKPELTLFIDSLVELTTPPIKHAERIREGTKEPGM